MFQFPGFAPLILTVPGLQPGGLPHSDTPGSSPVCGSPGLFAAYRVLPRLPKPRHPPYALTSLSLVNLSIREIVKPTISIDIADFKLHYTLPRCNLSVLSKILRSLTIPNPLDPPSRGTVGASRRAGYAGRSGIIKERQCPVTDGLPYKIKVED